VAAVRERDFVLSPDDLDACLDVVVVAVRAAAAPAASPSPGDPPVLVETMWPEAP
jgi:hypothetical protein